MIEGLHLNNEKEALMQIVRGLPLEKCEYRTDLVTETEGWFAPMGHIFKIAGRFTVWRNGSPNNVSKYSRPTPSIEEYIAENQEQYDEILKEADVNQKKALEALLDDNDDKMYFSADDLPNQFKGKWLVIRTSKQIELSIRGEVKPYIENGFILRIDNLTPDSDKKNPLMCDTKGWKKYQFAEWDQLQANANLGFCKIELVEYEEPEKTLLVPENNNDQKIQLPIPEESRMSTDDEIYMHERYVAKKKLSDEEREYMRKRLIQYSRGKRFLESRYSDDPLRDFIFPKNLNILRVPPQKTIQSTILIAKKSKDSEF